MLVFSKCNLSISLNCDVLSLGGDGLFIWSRASLTSPSNIDGGFIETLSFAVAYTSGVFWITCGVAPTFAISFPTLLAAVLIVLIAYIDNEGIRFSTTHNVNTLKARHKSFMQREVS